MPGFALTSLSLALLLALAPGGAGAVQTTPTDHAKHGRFVLPTFTFEDGTTLPNTVVSYAPTAA